jgi:hypothetical protein
MCGCEQPVCSCADCTFMQTCLYQAWSRQRASIHPPAGREDRGLSGSPHCCGHVAPTTLYANMPLSGMMAFGGA